jgi:hypothetical protein
VETLLAIAAGQYTVATRAAPSRIRRILILINRLHVRGNRRRRVWQVQVSSRRRLLTIQITRRTQDLRIQDFLNDFQRLVFLIPHAHNAFSFFGHLNRDQVFFFFFFGAAVFFFSSHGLSKHGKIKKNKTHGHKLQKH